MSRQASVVPNAEDAPMEEEDFGSDLELDEELENILVNVETEATAVGLMKRSTTDIEEIVPRISPFLEFRRKGWLSVSDLVGLIWCEVQVSLEPDPADRSTTSKPGSCVHNLSLAGYEVCRTSRPTNVQMLLHPSLEQLFRSTGRK